MQGCMRSEKEGGRSKGQELGYNRDPGRRYRDRDVGRDVICQAQNSNIEPMENGANGAIELERVSPGLVQRSGADIVL